MAVDYGFVYCLGNRCMPGIFKIGKTSRSVLERAGELSSSTSVPAEFQVLFYVETDRMSEIERAMHSDLSNYRISSNREFFECDPRIILTRMEEMMAEGCPFATSAFWEEIQEILEIEDHFEERAREGLENGQDQDGQA